MVYLPRVLIRVYPVQSDGRINPVAYNDFIDITNVEVQAGIDKTKDVFTLEIPNYKTGPDRTDWNNQAALSVFGDKIIRPNDVVVIFAWYGNNIQPVDSNILIYGIVRKYDTTVDGKRTRLKVSGINRTEELLRGMVPYTTISATTQTLPVTTIIKDIMRRLNQHNPNFKVQAELTTTTITETGTLGSIQTTRSDGTSFPDVSYNATWKPVYSQLEQLSTPDYTQDPSVGTYIFYLKPVPVLPAYQATLGPYTDVLVWGRTSLTDNGSIIEGRGTTGFHVDLDTREIINAMIVNAGKDINDNGVLGVAYDLESMGKNGTKWAYYTKSQKKFSELFKQEQVLGKASGSTFDATTGVPAAAAFPWVMHFTGTPTAANETVFNQKLRDQARTEAVNEANEVIKQLKNPRFAVTFDLDVGSNTYNMGDVYYFQIPSIGWIGNQANPGKKLRLRDQVQTINANGWQTRITAEEDEQVIQLLLQPETTS